MCLHLRNNGSNLGDAAFFLVKGELTGTRTNQNNLTTLRAKMTDSEVIWGCQQTKTITSQEQTLLSNGEIKGGM